MADDNKAFSLRQSAHAAKIRAERVVMNLFGASRSQIRNISSAMTRFQARQIKEAPVAQKPFPDAPPFKQTGTTTTFEPSKLTLGDNAPPQGGGLGLGSGLPTGAEGDILYHDGTDWVTLAKPMSMTLNPVLRYNLSTDAPYWDEPETC